MNFVQPWRHQSPIVTQPMSEIFYGSLEIMASLTKQVPTTAFLSRKKE